MKRFLTSALASVLLATAFLASPLSPAAPANAADGSYVKWNYANPNYDVAVIWQYRWNAANAANEYVPVQVRFIGKDGCTAMQMVYKFLTGYSGDLVQSLTSNFPATDGPLERDFTTGTYKLDKYDPRVQVNLNPGAYGTCGSGPIIIRN
jgi:hypothetical protein